MMLRSKFWTGLKSQTLKNSTHHFYDSIKDFQTLLREIRKVDQEDASFKSSKKATQQVYLLLTRKKDLFCKQNFNDCQKVVSSKKRTKVINSV